MNARAVDRLLATPSRWVETVACWVELPAEPEMIHGKYNSDVFAVGRLVEDLKAELAARDAVPLEHIELTVAPIAFDFELRASRILTAEVRALVLRHPNPFPMIRRLR